MSERYEKLFSSYDKYYSVGSPALIVAEAILKDTKENKVKAQLKFQNITNKTIKAVNIKIKAYDSFGRELQGIEEYQYADLSVFQGEYWGQDKAVTLPNELTRTINVSICSVIFQDDTIWECEYGWNKLSEPKTLYSLLLKDELVKQYKLEYGKTAEYVYLEEEGIWHCTCGAINQDSSSKCHSCKVERKSIVDCDIDRLQCNAERYQKDSIYNEALKKYTSSLYSEVEEAEKLFSSISEWKDSDSYISKCRNRKEELRLEEETKRKNEKVLKVKRVSIFILVLLVVSIAIVGGNYYTKVIVPRNTYEEAMEYIQNEKYNEAIEKLNVLLDSKYILDNMVSQDEINALINNCEEGILYKDAIALMEAGNYNEAINILTDNKYDTDKEQLKKCYMNLAYQEIEKKEYDQAIRYFLLADYKGESYQEIYYIRGIEAFNAKNYTGAIIYFRSIPEYKDSKEKIEILESKIEENIEEKKQREFISDEDRKLMQGCWYKALTDEKGGVVIVIDASGRLVESCVVWGYSYTLDKVKKEIDELEQSYMADDITNNGDGTFKTIMKNYDGGAEIGWYTFKVSSKTLEVTDTSSGKDKYTGTYKKVN